MRVRARAKAFGLGGTLALVMLLPACGCAPGRPGAGALEDDALPLLDLSPDENWTDHYNRLLARGPAALEYLFHRPEMRRPAAPDELRPLTCTSLIRLLLHPAVGPRLSLNVFETSYDLLHFDPKVRGQRLGAVVLIPGELPRSWVDLYPSDFDQEIAALVDPEADRLALQAWWHAARSSVGDWSFARPLRPQTDALFYVLRRRPADRWTWNPSPGSVRCSGRMGVAGGDLLPPRGSLISIPTADYNLVRAACIWLGSRPQLAIRSRLIDAVADRSPVVAYNAAFSLYYCRDPRIREMLEWYNRQAPEGNELPEDLPAPM